MTTGTFKILAIDGGGIRGVFPAHILQCIEQRLSMDIVNTFDMIAGTSTGAIIAAGIASHKSAEDIASLYQSHGHEIFGTPKKSLWPTKFKQGFHSKYCNASLQTVLKTQFGETRLGEISKPLLLPATDIGNGGVHVFKSNYNSDFNRDNQVLVREAVLASCSAPAFFDPATVDNYHLADGGVWANNPALAAVIDARYRLGIALDDIQVLSLGTGQSITAYGRQERKGWGLLTGWKNLEFIGFLLSLQAQSTQNYLQLMLKNEQLLRLDFTSDQPLPLDDVAVMDDLLSRADRLFSYQSADIKQFLSKE